MSLRPLPSLLRFTSLLATLALPAAGQQERLDTPTKTKVIQRIGEMLEQRYVFPDVATQCKAHLLAELKAGAFEPCTTLEAFSEKLTSALRSISHDKHLLVRPQPTDLPPMQQEDPAVAHQRRLDAMRERNFDWRRVELLADNVGYIDLHGFAPTGLARDTAVAAMDFVSHCDALIFDMRKNGGGYPDMVQFVCSYFFAQRTHLNSLYFREGDRTQEYWTLEDLPGQRMPDVPLFVLTSKSTFSGAEEFAYNLRTRERATIVGETTGGGANPGQRLPIDEQFEMIVPVGKAINPVTGTNWEGVGVEPHISVPADEALVTALAKARTAAEKFRTERMQRQREIREGIAFRISAAASAFRNDRSKFGVSIINSTLDQAYQARALLEEDVNRLGYDSLRNGDVEAAVAIFRRNAKTYPKSSNAWDSLGEGYMTQGKSALAIKNYGISLALDPNNENAVQMLKELKKR